MKSNLCFSALVLFFLLSSSDETSAWNAVIQQPDDPQLRTLLEARRDTLKQLVELVNMEMDIGHSAYTELSAANLLLTEAELETAGTPAERIACSERALESYREIERIVEALAEIGTVKAVDVLLARAARLKAEANLNEARNEAENLQLLQTRYETLKEAAQLIQIEVRAGFGPIETMSQVNELLLEAVSELPDHSEEGIAILGNLLADRTKIEKHFHAYWKANNLYEKHFLFAKAARVKAAINLHRAKKGIWPGRLGREDARVSATEEEPIDQELQSLLVEHHDTLKTVQRLVEKDGKTGVAQIADMINANHAYFNAELELAKSPQEQVAFLQEALKMQAAVERVAAAKHNAGTLRQSEYLPAKAARMKVEIELHIARKRAQ